MNLNLWIEFSDWIKHFAEYVIELDNWITDDSFKDKKERTETGQDAATISMLIQAIEKSMRVFWDFLRADKSENGLRGSRVDLQNPADIELLMNIQTDLQKVWFLK